MSETQSPPTDPNTNQQIDSGRINAELNKPNLPEWPEDGATQPDNPETQQITPLENPETVLIDDKYGKPFTDKGELVTSKNPNALAMQATVVADQNKMGRVNDSDKIKIIEDLAKKHGFNIDDNK